MRPINAFIQFLYLYCLSSAQRENVTDVCHILQIEFLDRVTNLNEPKQHTRG